jgi:prepilin-type N-terminal cleavage/methylation domain-containing protein
MPHDGGVQRHVLSPPRPVGDLGLSLIELLVAMSIATVVLIAAWAWVWNAGHVARGAARAAQATSSAAFAARTITDELSEAVVVAPPPAGFDPCAALCVEHRHLDKPAECVLIAWDTGRQVLWRKTQAGYLADHVEEFAVTYYDCRGERVDPRVLDASTWPAVIARVEVELDVNCCGTLCRRTVSVAMGA